MYFRRSLAYVVSIALIAQPLAAQTTAPAPAVAQAPNIKLDASETPEYARVLLEWPILHADSRTSVNGAMVIIQLANAINVDPIALKTKAPNFIVGAAISKDKKTIRLALTKPVHIVHSRDGNTEAIDLVNQGAPSTTPYIAASANTSAPITSVANDGKIHPLRNWPAPAGARRVAVGVGQSGGFTRISFSGPVLPNELFARVGDRIALTLPGLFALDVAPLRANLPSRVKDAVRYNDATHTSLVMDIEPGSVTRHGRQGDMIYVDILPPGTSTASENPDAKKSPETKISDAKPEAVKTETHATAPNTDPINPIKQTDAPSMATTLATQSDAPIRTDPAPSGKVVGFS